MCGLKQAPHVWFKKLGFIRLELDHGDFVSTDKQLFIAVYDSDLLIFGSDTARPEDVQQELRDRLFKMTDLGDISYYLGMQVNHVIGEKVTLCQNAYLKKVLDRSKMTECKLATVPINPRIAKSLIFFDRNADKKDIKWYQSAIGFLTLALSPTEAGKEGSLMGCSYFGLSRISPTQSTRQVMRR